MGPAVRVHAGGRDGEAETATSALSLVCLFGLPLIVALLVGRRVAGRQIVLGSDGVRIIGAARRHFIPYDTIASADLFGRIILTLKDGRKVWLGTTAQTLAESQDLLARVRGAMAGLGAWASGPRRLDTLERAWRPVDEWKGHLLRVARSQSSFREPALGVEDFEHVLVDPTAPADRRVGAAIALREVDAPASSRIRVAAAATANAGLRVALQAAADGEVDAEALDEALGAQATGDVSGGASGARSGRHEG